MVLLAHVIPATSASPSNLWEWITFSAMQFYRGHGLTTEVVRVIITLVVWFVIYGTIDYFRAEARKYTDQKVAQA